MVSSVYLLSGLCRRLSRSSVLIARQERHCSRLFTNIEDAVPCLTPCLSTGECVNAGQSLGDGLCDSGLNTDMCGFDLGE